MTTTTTTTTPQTKLVCDICLKRDGWRGLFLEQCCKCGVCVHHECYGGVESPSVQKKKWQCVACQAVGTEIEGFTLEGRKHKIMKVTERPVECALCSVAGGVHAMHALYHYYGERGRQVILPGFRKVPHRLAWVHTLCALSVCQNNNTRGAVYGCDEHGEYDGDGQTAYFVMCGLNGVKKDEETYVKNLTEHRELKCVVCGKHEKTAGRNLRVPLQCRAGDDDEFKEFKRHHENIGTPCTQAMHVGCAMWGKEGVHPQEPRRVWFFPGGEDGDEFEKPVSEIFCDCHAQQMGASMTGLKKGASQTKVGSTVLQWTVSGSEAPEPANAVEPSHTSHMSSKSQRDGLDGQRSDSSRTTKPTEGKSATGATRSISNEKETPTSSLFVGSIPRVRSNGTKATDFASPRPRAIQQPPVPITASTSCRESDVDAIPLSSVPIVSTVPRRPSANEATRAHINTDSSGGTSGGTFLSTVPRKAAPAQQTRAPIAASAPRPSSASNTIQRAPVPIAAVIRRQASPSSDAERTNKSVGILGSTTGETLLSTIPLKVTPTILPSLPKASPLTAKQRRNLLVPSHLLKEHVTPIGGVSSLKSHLSQLQHASQSLPVNDTFNLAEGETLSPAVAAAIASTDLQTSCDDGKSVGRENGSVLEDTQHLLLEKGKRRRRTSLISEHKQDDASTPTTKKRFICDEGKEDEVNEIEMDDDRNYQEGSWGRKFDRDDCEGDGGLWMDDEANGIIQGNELEADYPGGEDPWAYLWKPGAPSFEVEVIACAERRNVEGLMKSLRPKK